MAAVLSIASVMTVSAVPYVKSSQGRSSGGGSGSGSGGPGVSGSMIKYKNGKGVSLVDVTTEYSAS